MEGMAAVVDGFNVVWLDSQRGVGACEPFMVPPKRGQQRAAVGQAVEMRWREREHVLARRQSLSVAAEPLQEEGLVVVGVHIIGTDRDRSLTGGKCFAVLAELGKRNRAGAEDLDHVRIYGQNSVEAGKRLVRPAGSKQRQAAIVYCFGWLHHAD